MKSRRPDLPNIEDDTLRACLAPLMEAMTTGGEPAVSPMPPVEPTGAVPAPLIGRSSNDNPALVPEPAEIETPPLVSGTSTDWRAEAGEDHATLRMIEMFLSRTGVDLDAAARDFPRQLGGTLARVTAYRDRMAARYEAAAAVRLLLTRALEGRREPDAGAD